MDQEKLTALLGRPLTDIETANLDLYLEIADTTLQDMLCIDLESTTEERELDAREGYRTLFTGIFTAVESIEVEGELIPDTDYSLRQWDKRNKDWYNSIVFTTPRCGVIKVTADWGFDECWPLDLQRLYAKVFDQIGKSSKSAGLVQSKQTEDFRVTFRTDITEKDLFQQECAPLIRKYGMCGIGEIQHGNVGIRHFRDYDLYVSYR